MGNVDEFLLRLDTDFNDLELLGLDCWTGDEGWQEGDAKPGYGGIADHVAVASVALSLSLSAYAEITPFPASFHPQEVQTEGATIHVVIGGQGPAVVLVHGFGDTGEMWSPLAAQLAHEHIGHW
eukprot:gene26488-29027_t